MTTKVDTLDVEAFLDADSEALHICNKWQEWDSYRQDWKSEKIELRNYLYATDTRTTSNNRLDWANSTTVPKLTQIYDNLKANYLAALFPRKMWFDWKPLDNKAASKAKANVIKQFMLSKLEQDQFELTAEALVDDFIIYGNKFGIVEWVSEREVINEGTDLEEVVEGYVGPRLSRISPLDIVFNPAAPRFQDSPKIIRSIVTEGSLKKYDIAPELLEKVYSNRNHLGTYPNLEKQEAYVADGFSDLTHYYGSGFVEILTFYGDIYDKNSGQLRTNRKITIIDRAYVVKDEPFTSWSGHDGIFHASWRSRPDNLWGMGPLDNLVGMQYRGDHLENLKADVFDFVALGMIKIRGDVEDFEHRPGERIYMGEEGDVEFLTPDATVLAVDNQIAILHQQMEEFAGAPRQAMGIRTPGEKTAFEVQNLAEGASRIFQHKASKSEKEFFEPVLNDMFRSAKQNMDRVEVIEFFDEPSNSSLFVDITRKDIAANGALKPIGARHFAEQQRRIQTLNNLIQVRLADPSVGAHLSGKKIAEIMAEEVGEPDLFKPTVAIEEQLEIQEASQDAEAQNFENLALKQELGE